MVSAALRLAELGIAVHWLRGPHSGDEKARGKAPISKGWKTMPALSAAQLIATYRPGFNLGIHTGHVEGARHHLVAVDCDSLEAARWCARRLPPTPLRTGTRQGWHLYYLRPVTAERIPNRLKVAGMALDVRADRGNIVAAPSVHPSGFVYAEREPWTLDRLERLPVYDPAWMPAPAPAAARPVLDPRALARWRRDDGRRYEAARAALHEMRPSTGHDGGESRLWTAALMLAARFQLDETQIVALLVSDYLPRCTKPWPEWRVLRKAGEAVRSRAALAARAGGQ